MKTIKRTLALVIVFCLMISFVPVALAADDDATVTTNVTALNGLTVGSVASVNVTYSLSAGTWKTTANGQYLGTLPNGLSYSGISGNDGTSAILTVTISGTPTTSTATWAAPSTIPTADIEPTIGNTVGTLSYSTTGTIGTIAKATLVSSFFNVDSGTASYSYDGNAHDSSATLNTGYADTGITIKYLGTGSTTYDSSTAPSAVGTYELVVAPSISGGANASFSDTATPIQLATFSIVKGTGAATGSTITTSNVTTSGFTATGATSTTGDIQYAASPSPTASEADLASLWQAAVSSGNGATIFTGLAAGTTYYVYARSAASTNYNAGAKSTPVAVTTTANGLTAANFTLSNNSYTYAPGASRTVTVTPTGGYTGTPTAIYYNNSTTAPIDAGSYTITVDAPASDGYAAVSGLSIGTLTITAATLTPGTNFTAPVANTNLTYTGNALSLVTAGAVGTVAGTFTYATTQAGTYGAIPTGITAGTYTVWYKFTPSSSNYAAYSSTAAISVTIAKAATSATASAVPTSYSKTSTSITVTGLTSSNTTTNPNVEYAISQNSGASATNLTWYSVTSGSRYTFSGLSSNTTYYIYARPAASTNYLAGAVRTSAAIKTTADSSFTTDVKGVTATSASTTSIKVSWTKATPTPSYYYVYYSTSSSFTTSTTDYVRVTGSYTSTTITGLDKNTKYYFYVVATLDGYTDSKSSTVNATTGGTSNTTDYFVVNTSESSSKATSSIDAYEFSDAAVGYAQPDPETFWIHNVYGSTIKGITVKLTGDNKSSFTLSTSKIESQLDKSEETYFTLVPNEGLKKGTYECTITISASTSAVEDYVIDVTFEVGTASLYFSTKKSGTAISSLEFDNAVEGYSISGTQTLYVNNDSGSQLKGVEVAISGTDKSSFKLTGGSLGTIKDGDYASFEIAPVAGLTAGTYTAKLTVSNTTNTKTATMTLSFKVTAGTGTVDTTPTPTASFVDTTSHWAKDYIESLYAQGYVSGIGSNQFAPNNTLTRAQFVQFLYNGFGSGAIASACPFADVDQTAWYKNAVNWAYANGLVTGYSSTEFGPNYPITREQMATIMGRLSEQYGVSLPSTNARAAFADDSDIASYAKDYVYKMQMADIISGKSGNVFDPKGNTTRGEMSKVMYYVLYYAGKIGTAYRVA